MFFWKRKHRAEDSAVTAGIAQPEATLLAAGIGDTEWRAAVWVLVNHELEREIVRQERSRLPTEEQSLFALTFGSFLYCVVQVSLRGFASTERRHSGEQAVREGLARQAWFDPDEFAEITSQMALVLPSELTVHHRYGGMISPAADMMLAAQLAGFSADIDYSPEFSDYMEQLTRRLPEKLRSTSDNQIGHVGRTY